MSARSEKTKPKTAPRRKRAAAPAARSSRKGGAGGNGQALVVVESPAKARTIKKYLGPRYRVCASVGHVKDLPKSKLGVAVDDDFAPEYVIIRGKTNVLKDIRKNAREVERVYLAPDPDREGEAIAWHLAEEIRPVNGRIHRVLFNEITKRGVLAALERPAELDRQKYDAQQARRILDRLVGYQISPILWGKVRRGLSAGRVQSVAVRLVVEREREIKAFEPVEYWSIECDLEGRAPPPFSAAVHRVDGAKPELPDGDRARALAGELAGASFTVAAVERKERRKFPPPPFITSRLQQEAARKLRMTAKRTMALAQRLYEGVELGPEGAVGLITYMRTDSVRLADEAIAAARGYVTARYGAEFVPDEPVVYRSKKGAQDAHEAIRPTSVDFPPERVRDLLGSGGGDAREHDDLVRLYTLIWNRFVACQMKPALYDQTSCDIAAGRVVLRATGQVLKFAGYTSVYDEVIGKDERPAGEGEGEGEDARDGALPELAVGDRLSLREVRPEQHFTQPPPRFTEASLIRELEEKGIGRPSTYASILSTIQEREYVAKREGRFSPTPLGEVVNDLLVASFPDVLNVEFTAQMEEHLDQVEDGARGWLEVLREFYGPFKTDLVKAEAEMPEVKRLEEKTDLTCEKCGKPMVIKWGRKGRFLACSGYPECRNTRDFTQGDDGAVIPVELPTTDEKCPACQAPMLVKSGRFGEFLACSRYPDCKTTRPLSLGVDCPRPGCGGFLTARRSRRGKPFYGCSNYSKTGCDFVSWDRPIPEPCPSCGAPFVTKRELRGGTKLRCVKDGCGWIEDSGEAA